MIPPLPSDIFRQGQVLNNTYEIEGVIGRGGTGEVYLARNLVSGRVVAIKGLSLQFGGNDAYVELMRREEQMRDIAHDAVVRYTECSRSDDGHVFLVMDHIDGPSLQDEMQRRRFDPRELMIVAHRVAEGLGAAHRRGIVHRDLSPDNVVLRGGAPDRATIIDFGIAKDTTAGARTIVGNDFAGKYEYAAPEQLEGRSDARSDLYALGASLLAAWRGEVPFAGSTPGEIVRRKQGPLDTAGVPEPLKGLIDWLSAPRPDARPASAAAVTARIDAALAKGRRTSGPPGRGPATWPGGGRRRGGLVAALLVLAAVGGGVAAWRAGALDAFLAGEPPAASPYRLEASVAGGQPTLSGHAPDPAAAALLRQAFGAAAGATPPEDAIAIAPGMPSEGWAEALAGMMGPAAALEDWTLEAEDLAVRLDGLAPDAAARDRLAADLAARAEAAGLQLDLDLAAGPRVLEVERVEEVLADAATCGPLALLGAPEEGYPLGATIEVAGELAEAGDEDRLRQALAARAGDREVALRTAPLDPDLCRVRAALPPTGAGDLSIWMGDGATGEANPAGVFEVGDNPVVEVQAPASLVDGYLTVVVVNDTGTVFNLLPNIAAAEHRIAEVGEVESGVRAVRVLHSLEEFAADQTLIGTKITESDVGRSEIIALLTGAPLFDVRRPRDESPAAFAEALAEAQAAMPGNIRAVATRVLEARP